METTKYRLIAFMRIEPEDSDPLTYTEALSEKDQQEMMCPENLYQIEEIPAPVETQTLRLISTKSHHDTDL